MSRTPHSARHSLHCDARREHGDGLCECGTLVPTTLLVCGTRHAPETPAARAWVRSHIAALVEEHGITRIVHGGARGVDRLADQAAAELGMPAVVYVAEWERHGGGAGPLRNRRMMETERPGIVLAYPRGGPGTADMIAVARAAGAMVVTR